MPAVFIGHGSPMNTLADNHYTQAWRHLGQSLPRPKAILVASANWYIDGVSVTAMERPGTIHDSYGFPQGLFDFQYPAPGSPAMAERVRDILALLSVGLDCDTWGLDHGTWSVLTHVYPQVDVPVVQLSIDRRQPPAFHYDLGKRLAPLRDEQVLLIGSGNIVHNLRMMRSSAPYDWALRFDQMVKDHIQWRDHTPLIDYERLDPQACLAVPTPEHYLPLLYILGAQQSDEVVQFPVEGIDIASISMRSVVVGRNVEKEANA